MEEAIEEGFVIRANSYFSGVRRHCFFKGWEVIISTVRAAAPKGKERKVAQKVESRPFREQVALPLGVTPGCLEWQGDFPPFGRLSPFSPNVALPLEAQGDFLQKGRLSHCYGNCP